MESLFSGSYHPVQIAKAEYLTSQLKKVTFEGDFSKLSKPFIAGNVIEFRVSDTEFRHYTPSFFNPSDGICEVLFYLHDKGPGSHWAEKIKAGDSTRLLGPGGKIRFDEQSRKHLCFGDETSLGLMKCIADEAGKRNLLCKCVAELDAGHSGWPDLLELECAAARKDTAAQARESIDRIDEWLRKEDVHDTAFYLTGNAKSIQAVKKHLTGKGIHSRRIHTEPYWAEGKAGL